MLGAQIEKEITTPEYYPLSLNALVNACNQKSNRDPVVSYDEDAVLDAIESLREKRFATIITGAGSRVPKYAQRFSETLNLGRREMAVLCELMLRGPQTTGELRTRCERMHRFDDLQEVEIVIERLPEMITKLPRRAGACTKSESTGGTRKHYQQGSGEGSGDAISVGGGYASGFVATGTEFERDSDTGRSPGASNALAQIRDRGCSWSWPVQRGSTFGSEPGKTSHRQRCSGVGRFHQYHRRSGLRWDAPGSARNQAGTISVSQDHGRRTDAARPWVYGSCARRANHQRYRS